MAVLPTLGCDNYKRFALLVGGSQHDPSHPSGVAADRCQLKDWHPSHSPTHPPSTQVNQPSVESVNKPEHSITRHSAILPGAISGIFSPPELRPSHLKRQTLD